MSARKKHDQYIFFILLAVSFFILKKFQTSDFISPKNNLLLSVTNSEFKNYSKPYLWNFLKKETGNNNITRMQAKQNAKNAPLVTLYFDGIPTVVNISKAPLKYNKSFAYSLTFDDGKEDAYTNAFPLLHGGYSSETGQTYPGLNFTDGCGNNIPFKAGIAINSVGSNGFDNHVNTPESITWEQVKELYNNGWDVLNHSYNHQYGPGTDYNAEIIDNTNYIKSKTGITTTEFVIPSGDSEYTSYAFNNGMKAVYNQKDFPGGNGLKIDSPLVVQDFKLYRQYLDDSNYENFAGKVDAVANNSSAINHYWYSEFTHHVSETEKAGGLMFPYLKAHMEKIEASYGVKGSDNIWMAPLQEVYEYLNVRELSVTNNLLDGDKSNIYIDFNSVPKDLRRYAMTLVVNSDRNITSVDCPSASTITFNGTTENKIINLEWLSAPEGTTGIFENRNKVDLVNIYPNPVENELTVYLPGIINKTVTISLYDEKGIKYTMGEEDVPNEVFKLNFGSMNLKKGLYIIKFQTKDGSFQSSKTIVKY